VRIVIARMIIQQAGGVQLLAGVVRACLIHGSASNDLAPRVEALAAGERGALPFQPLTTLTLPK